MLNAAFKFSVINSHFQIGIGNMEMDLMPSLMWLVNVEEHERSESMHSFKHWIFYLQV
jgi:hypothetical protein